MEEYKTAIAKLRDEALEDARNAQTLQEQNHYKGIAEIYSNALEIVRKVESERGE